MNTTSFTAIAATGFGVAFLHAAIPTHWLPFVLVGRARNWSRAKTMSVTLLAGTGHVLLTSVLGLVIAWCGHQLDGELAHAFPWLASALLLAVGAYYWHRQFHRTGACRHPFPHAAHPHAAPHGARDSRTTLRRDDWTAIGGLLLMLTLSPCEGFLAVYLAGLPFGWDGYIVLSATLALATLPGMLVLTYLAMRGAEGIKLPRLHHYDAGVLGTIFSLLGVFMLMAEH
jgi:nickel/cobalt transporter (NicO) family protein